MPINTTYFPPISPFVLPHEPLDALIKAYGVRLLWRKSHTCPCTFASDLPGSPVANCNQCLGRGTYWDQPACEPFMGLVTFMHLAPSPDEPGAIMDEKFGLIQRAEPTLTIPFASGKPWVEASLNDIFVQIDAIDRFNAQLKSGEQEKIPYQEQLCVEASGAVTVYDSATRRAVLVSGYVVSGASVTIPSGYPQGTPYIVEFDAAKVYVAWRDSGSIPHDRPFGMERLPKRYRLQTLDLWTRGLGR